MNSTFSEKTPIRFGVVPRLWILKEALLGKRGRVWLYRQAAQRLVNRYCANTVETISGSRFGIYSCHRKTGNMPPNILPQTLKELIALLIFCLKGR